MGASSKLNVDYQLPKTIYVSLKTDRLYQRFLLTIVEKKKQLSYILHCITATVNWYGGQLYNHPVPNFPRIQKFRKIGCFFTQKQKGPLFNSVL